MVIFATPLLFLSVRSQTWLTTNGAVAQCSFIHSQAWMSMPLIAAILFSTEITPYFSTHLRHFTIQLVRDTIFRQKLRLETPIKLSTLQDSSTQRSSKMFGLAIRIQAGQMSSLPLPLFGTCAILPSTWDLVVSSPRRHLVNSSKALLIL